MQRLGGEVTREIFAFPGGRRFHFTLRAPASLPSGRSNGHFQHLVNLRREAGFNRVNILLGYPSVRIVSPLELIYGNEEEV